MISMLFMYIKISLVVVLSLMAAYAYSDESINVKFIGCEWKIPNGFDKVNSVPLEYSSPSFYEKGLVRFENQVFDEKTLQSPRVKKLKVNKVNELLLYSYVYVFNEEDETDTMAVSVVSGVGGFILMLDLSKEQIKYIGKNCLLNKKSD